MAWDHLVRQLWDHLGLGKARACRCPVHTRCQTVRRIWEGSGVAFREVGVHEIREVLRLKFEGRLSHERIAAATGLSKGAVSNCAGA